MESMDYSEAEKKARFEEYYRKYYTEILKTARLRLKNDAIAEEITQEVFVTAWDKVVTLIEHDAPRGWLMRVLYWKLVNMQEEMARFFRMTELNEDEVSDPNAEQDLILKYEGLIPDEDLALLYRNYVQKIPCAQLAKELGIGLSACKMRVFRARRAFKEAYQRKIDEF